MQGANFLIFPAFSLSDYFPNHEGLIASLVIGLQNSSTAITSILDIIYRQYPNVTLQTLFISYLFFVLLPLGLFFILASPLIRPSLNPQFMYKDIGTLANSDEKTSDICNIIARADLSPSASERDVPKKTNYRRMIKQDLVTIEMLLIGVFTSATVLQFNFYPTILRDISGDAIARFNGWLLPTQGLIGVVYGLVIDKVGTLPVCHALLMMVHDSIHPINTVMPHLLLIPEIFSTISIRLELSIHFA